MRKVRPEPVKRRRLFGLAATSNGHASFPAGNLVIDALLNHVVAYALRYGCTSLELAHPRPPTTENDPAPAVFKLQAAGRAGSITIKVKLVPMWSPPPPEHEHETADFDQAEAA